MSGKAYEQRRHWDTFDKPIDAKNLERKIQKQGGIILRHVDMAGKAVLDIGCGEGFIDRYLERLTVCDITGLEYVKNRCIQFSKVLKDAKVVQADARALPFQDSSFDVVMAIELLHHLERADVFATTREMTRVCRPGGNIVLIEPNRLNPLIIGAGLAFPEDRRLFQLSIPDVVKNLKKAGFVVQVKPVNFYSSVYRPFYPECLRSVVYMLEDVLEKRFITLEYAIFARKLPQCM